MEKLKSIEVVESNKLGFILEGICFILVNGVIVFQGTRKEVEKELKKADWNI